MLDKTLVEKLNIPEDVFLEINKKMQSGYGNLVEERTKRSMQVSRAFKEAADKIWSANEVAFIKHGTTRKQSDLFAKEIFLKSVQILLDGLFEGSTESP